MRSRGTLIVVAIPVIALIVGVFGFVNWQNNANKESVQVVADDRVANKTTRKSPVSTPEPTPKADSEPKPKSKSKPSSEPKPAKSPTYSVVKVAKPIPAPAPRPAPAPSPSPVSPTGRVLGVYWIGWNQGGSMLNVDTDYSVIYLFAATRTEGTGNLQWYYDMPTGLQEARDRGQKVILSTGGAGQGIHFTSRTISQQFVDSFKQIAASLGGVDGVDFNTFEAERFRM